MQVSFSAEQKSDPAIRMAESILRACVHCGFCLPACPTYQVAGDERDSPRGRIWLIKDMLESGRMAPGESRHIDRCLSCLACQTACPSGVDYQHLVDLARVRIERDVPRPLADRVLRGGLDAVLTRPGLFRLAALAGIALRRAAGLFRLRWPGAVGRTLGLLPGVLPPPSPVDRPASYFATKPAGGFAGNGPRRRVMLLPGCVQTVLAPSINEATVRLLRRAGCEVVVPTGSGCCGALSHHMGREARALHLAAANLRAFAAALENGPVDAIVTNAGGCGVVLKDYGHMLAGDPERAALAQSFAERVRDIGEVLVQVGLPQGAVGASGTKPVLAYQAACSLSNGQKGADHHAALLTAAGFALRPVAGPDFCCGSAGTYNLTQPHMAADLRARKWVVLRRSGAVAVASGNIGCMTHLAAASDALPLVHTVELLDWATGGPRPATL